MQTEGSSHTWVTDNQKPRPQDSGTWLKEDLWDRYHKHWVLGRNYCRCVLMLQMQETPAVFQVQPLSQCWVSLSPWCSQALGTLAWPSHAVGPTPKEQQGGIVEIFAFFIYLGLLLFVLVS